MALKINPSKLLPQAKSSSIVKTEKPALKISEKKVNIASSIRIRDNKSFALSKDVVKPKKIKDAEDVNNKLLKIDKFFKSELTGSQKKSEEKRKEKEKKDFEEAENKLELPRLKGFSLPKLPSLPTFGILDRIKRFLFFTAVGWLLPKLLEFLPKLEGFVKTIGDIYQFAEGLFGKLLDGFMSLVKFGGDLKNKTLGFIAQVKAGNGGNFQKEFDKLEKQFNNFANLSIIAGLLGADIGLAALDEYNKWKNRNKQSGKPKPGEPSKPSAKSGARVTTGRGGKPGLGKGARVTTGKGGKQPSWINKLLSKLNAGPLGKLAKPFSRFLGAAIPFAGAGLGALDATARAKSGDKVGAWIAGSSAALDAFAGGVALAAGGFLASIVGAPVAAALATAATVATGISVALDVILLVRDILNIFGIKTFSNGGRVLQKYQDGGTTRGGQPVLSPIRRTLRQSGRRKPVITKPQKTEPGKDVGGKNKIIGLYPNPDEVNRPKPYTTGFDWLSWLKTGDQEVDPKNTPNPYKALTKTSEILKKIPLIGGIMGASVDVALGQKPDKRIYQSFSSAITYIINTMANQRVSQNISSIARDIKGFADGGYVQTSSLMSSGQKGVDSGELISKLLGTTIDQRINEAIQTIEKELQKKKKDGAAPDEDDEQPPLEGDEYEYQVSGGELPSKYVNTSDYNELRPQGHRHAGEDYPINQGTAITVIVPGRVAEAQEDHPVAGGYILITHEDGSQTRYLHLSRLNVRVGDEVPSGTVIGLTGGQPGTRGAGRTSGPHLHFEYYRTTKSGHTDPKPYADRYFRFNRVTRVTRTTRREPDSYDTSNMRGTGKIFTGSASWYGRKDGFQGKPTSNGEIFDTDKLTAAIQIGLRNEFGGVSAGKPVYYAKVTNTENNKSVVVRINDVGPLVPGGVIDLSEAAFKKIASGGLGQGRIPNVKVEKLTGAPRIVPRERNAPPGPSQRRIPQHLIIAYGTNDWGLSEREIERRAKQMIQSAKTKGYTPVVVIPNKNLLVNGVRRSGPYNAVLKAAREMSAIIEMGVYDQSDTLHLTNGGDIKRKYSNAKIIGDSNAVRIAGGRNVENVRVVGAGGNEIQGYINRLQNAPAVFTTSTGLQPNLNYGLGMGEEFVFTASDGKRYKAKRTDKGIKFYTEGGLFGIGGREVPSDKVSLVMQSFVRERQRRGQNAEPSGIKVSIYSGHADMLKDSSRPVTSAEQTQYGTMGGISRLINPNFYTNEAYINDLIARRVAAKASQVAVYRSPIKTAKGRDPNSNWERAKRDIQNQRLVPFEMHHDQPGGSAGLLMGNNYNARLSNPFVKSLHNVFGRHPGDQEKGFFKYGGAIVEISRLTPAILKDQRSINSHVERESSKVANALTSARMQSGGSVLPSKSNLPIPNSFASYNDPSSTMMIAYQPIMIKQQTPTSSGSNNTIAFPVPVVMDVNNIEQVFNSSRGY